MRLRVGLAVIGLMVFAGCTSQMQVQRAGGTTMLVEATAPRGVGLMAFEGTLTRTEAGCLVLSGAANPALLQFPFGSRLADDGQSVEIPGQGVIRIGDPISAGGQAGDPATVSGVPRECAGLTSMLLWQ